MGRRGCRSPRQQSGDRSKSERERKHWAAHGGRMVRAFRGVRVARFRPVRGYTVAPRGCGGIGRRARFRSVWASARGGSSPLIRIARLDGLERFLLDDCEESTLSGGALLAGGGAPPQCGQGEIFRVAVLAEPVSLLRERFADVAVDLAQHRQQSCADGPAAHALPILADPEDMGPCCRSEHGSFVGRRGPRTHTRTASLGPSEVRTSPYLREPLVEAGLVARPRSRRTAGLFLLDHAPASGSPASRVRAVAGPVAGAALLDVRPAGVAGAL